MIKEIQVQLLPSEANQEGSLRQAISQYLSLKKTCSFEFEILKKSSPEVFETLLQRFRPKNLNKPEKEIFKDIAHNIRNSDSNIRAIKKEKEAKLEIKKSRSIRFYKNSLFPMTM